MLLSGARKVAKAQKPGWQGGIADQKVFARSWNCTANFQTVWKASGGSRKCLDGPKSFWVVWKMFRWSGKFLEGLESCRRIWKVSRWSGKLVNWYIGHHLDRIFDWICWIWSSVEWSGKFPDGLESSGMVWKVSEWSGKFSSGLEGFSMCKWLPKMFSSLFSEAQFVNYGLGRVHLSDFAILVARQGGRHAILSNNANSSHLLIWLPNGFFVPTTSSYIRNETKRIM